MQVPKKKIRNQIIQAATEEFLVAGYSRASMRNIADQAGITVGNIYAYFSSKDALFESIVGPVVTELNKLIALEGKDVSPTSVTQLTESITQVFLSNRNLFLILMNGSAESKFANIREELTTLVRQRLISDLLPQLPQSAQDPLLADALAVAALGGILNIFNKYGGDEQRLKSLIKELLLIIFTGIETRL